VWDEAQKLAGKGTDYHRRDLWESIEMGDYPEWELGVQVVEEENEHAFEFDILDPTKLIPEELVPITPLGKMVLNRNPDNFFAETEQVAFCPGHVVPGIDFSNDPLQQGRLFSYTDTQIWHKRSRGVALHPTCPRRIQPGLTDRPQTLAFAFFGFKYLVNPWNQITSAGLPLI
jgi:catalase